MPLGSRLGGSGFSTMPGMYQLGQSGFDAGADRLAQAQRDLSNIILTVSEKRKDRQAQRKQQKRAISAQKKQFWTGLGVQAGGALATGAILGALPGGGEAGLSGIDTAGEATGSTLPQVAATSKAVAGGAEGFGGALDLSQVAPLAGQPGTTVGELSSSVAGTPMASADLAGKGGAFTSLQGVDVPSRSITPINQGGGYGDIGKIPGVNTKYAFGDTLGGSMLRGAGLGLASVSVPTLSQHVLQAPLQMANIGLGYARMGQTADLARERMTSQEGIAAQRSTDYNKRTDTMGQGGGLSANTAARLALDPLAGAMAREEDMNTLRKTAGFGNKASEALPPIGGAPATDMNVELAHELSGLNSIDAQLQKVDEYKAKGLSDNLYQAWRRRLIQSPTGQ